MIRVDPLNFPIPNRSYGLHTAARSLLPIRMIQNKKNNEKETFIYSRYMNNRYTDSNGRR